MLLRQLYLSHYAEERFEAAYEVAAQALDLDVLPDVLHQDAARAKQALGELEAAVGHLRLAARTSPPSRKAFHCWTLGSVLLLAGRHAEAIAALGRAARWGTTDKPLYEGHLAAAKLAAGQTVRHPERLIERLAACPAGQGYGRFVLGLLSHHTGQRHAAREYLGAFVKRVSEGQRMTAMALRGELALARELLGEDDLC
jgi:tetratricopeptide (TPR) repeat protein